MCKPLSFVICLTFPVSKPTLPPHHFLLFFFSSFAFLNFLLTSILNQAWKKCLFPCKLGKISLQQGRFPSSVGWFPLCISLFFPSKSQDFSARSFPFCLFFPGLSWTFFLFSIYLEFPVTSEMQRNQQNFLEKCQTRKSCGIRGNIEIKIRAFFKGQNHKNP